MIRTYHLEPITAHVRPLAFTWNPEAGTFEGEDIGELVALCEYYRARGTVTSHPYPTSYPCTDPQHNPAHLAAILSTRWRLPDELAEALPRLPEDDRGEVEVVY